MNMVALNASDVRTKEKLGRRIGEATKTVSLFGGRSLIFLDEVDGLLGRSDYGGRGVHQGCGEGDHEPHHHGGQRPEADEIKKLALGLRDASGSGPRLPGRSSSTSG